MRALALIAVAWMTLSITTSATTPTAGAAVAPQAAIPPSDFCADLDPGLAYDALAADNLELFPTVSTFCVIRYLER